MSLTLNEYRCELINKILFAESQNEVKHFIDTGLKKLEAFDTNGGFTVKLLAQVIEDLNEFSPMNFDAQQWSNIKMARILCNKARRSLHPGQYQ